MNLLILKLFPVLLALLVFVLSRRVYLTLMAGILSAAIIYSDWAIFSAMKLIRDQLLISYPVQDFFSWTKFLASGRLLLMCFIVSIYAFINILCKTGVVFGYYNFLNNRVKSKVGAELSCLVLGFSLFIDDYLNVMLNSRVSTMFCSRFKIPRLKIAFLITCLAAPLCTVIPISSWTAELLATISGTLFNTKFANMDSFSCLLQSIPFFFFSLFSILGSLSIVLFKYSYGEIERLEKTDLTPSTENDIHPNAGRFGLLHFLLPVSSIIISVILSIIVFAGYFEPGSKISLLQALQSNPYPEKSLLTGSLISLAITCTGFLFIGFISIKELLACLLESIFEAGFVIQLLILSNTFGRLLGLLGTGTSLASMMTVVVSPALFPVLAFIVSALFSMLLGSSWATIAIMFPMLLPTVFTFDHLSLQALYKMFFISLGASLSGILLGSSLSPVNDLIVMSSKGSNVLTSDYLKVQIQYLLPVGLACLVSFFFAGSLVEFSFAWLWGISFLAGMLVLNVVYFILSNVRWTYS